MSRERRRRAAIVAALAIVLASGAHAGDTTPAALVERYAAEAGIEPAQIEVSRGERLYRSERANGRGPAVSCTGCHTPDPRQAGRTRVGKTIEPLAPAANGARFTDSAKVEKWFGRNCKDVLERTCTAQEKGEFIAWLMTVK